MIAARALFALCVLASGAADAASLAFCDRAIPLTAAEQDRLLRFAAVARDELERSGASLALISRSGLDLSRFRIRYSHAGLGLRSSHDGNDGGAWSVRQLYYACDERRPRLFDQGLAGFASGTDDPRSGYLSIVLLPAEAAAPIEHAALDRPRALRLLAARYSANAHPFDLRYQNCNGWVMELLATSWGRLPDGEDLRARAQAWLRAAPYEPAPVEVGSHLWMFAGSFVPWVHLDDHPEADRFALRLRTSLPSTIEAFVRERVPEARRIELCHDGQRVVVRQGWVPIAEGCRPEPGDRAVTLD